MNEEATNKVIRAYSRWKSTYLKRATSKPAEPKVAFGKNAEKYPTFGLEINLGNIRKATEFLADQRSDGWRIVQRDGSFFANYVPASFYWKDGLEKLIEV